MTCLPPSTLVLIQLSSLTGRPTLPTAKHAMMWRIAATLSRAVHLLRSGRSCRTAWFLCSPTDSLTHAITLVQHYTTRSTKTMMETIIAHQKEPGLHNVPQPLDGDGGRESDENACKFERDMLLAFDERENSASAPAPSSPHPHIILIFAPSGPKTVRDMPCVVRK
jgi:hypothetical protein